eukprot:GHVL01016763.1.p1 GENE.GHVL01016763.1~~GHVL01016763.1.p1  ORF type:complete len:240 (-),score=66.61 GHVL01016763.1:253-972(-)
MWGIIVCGFLLLLSLIACYIIYKRYRYVQTSILYDEDKAFNCPSGRQEITQYENERHNAFINVWGHDKELPDTDDEWFALLSSQERKTLMTLLMKRTMVCIPRSKVVESEYRGRYNLYRRGLVSDRHWSSCEQERDQLLKEIELIRCEAELLRKDWGQQIFAEAMKLHKNQQSILMAEEEEKRKLAAEKKRLDNEEKNKKWQLEKDEKMAKQAAESLLKEESTQKQKEANQRKKTISKK